MAKNFFDQFDSEENNFFDRFDEPEKKEPQPVRQAPAPAPAADTFLTGNPMGDEFGSAIMDQAAPAPADSRGIIQRVGDFLRPAPAPSILERPAPPDMIQAQQQAEIDRRLGYGAGPIRPEIVRSADEVRSARGTGNEIKFKSPSVADRVGRVVNEMDRRGEASTASALSSLGRQTIRDGVTQSKAEEFRSVGEWAVDSLSNVSQGVVTLAQLPTNIIAPGSSLAESLRQTQKELQAEESDVAKASREVLRQRIESEDGFLGKYFATVSELITNPTLSISEGLKQIPMFIGVVGGAKLGSAAAGAGVAAAGRAMPTVALANAIGGGALTAGARAAGSTVGGVGASMVMAGGDAAGNTYETLTDLKKTPLSEWQKNPDFQKLVSEGVTEKDAIQEIATTKARMAALPASLLGILGFMGAEAAVVGRGVGRAAADALTLKGAAKLVAKENLTEQLEEGGTQLVSNLLTSTVKQDQSLMEGVPEAMATAAITSTPFGVLGAYSQYRTAQEQGRQSDPVADYIARSEPGTRNVAPEFISPRQTVRGAADVGPAPLAPTVTNFTPPDSATRQAGLVDIEVPLPNTPPALPEINTSTEQQFGLDKLRMGGSNVGTSGVPGGLAGAGGEGGGGVLGGGLDAAGLGDGPGAGDAGGTLGGVRPDGGPALPSGGPAGQPAAGLGQTPAKIWAGRAGDGYTQSADAQQALPGLQRKYPALTWSLQQDADGKFFWSGTTRGDASGTAVTGAAGQGLAGTAGGDGAQQAGAAGAGLVDLRQVAVGQPGQPGGAATVGGASANEPAFTLNLAPTAPLQAAGRAITMLKSARGVEVELYSDKLTDQQKVASAMARLVGKTATYVSQVGGAAEDMPNGFVIPGQDKNIYLDSNSADGALFVMMHEGVHALPKPIRQKLVSTLKGLTKADMRGDFASRFGYDANNDYEIDNEIAAFMTQAVSKRADFWQELRTKMGDGDFVEVAKVILDKLTSFLDKADKTYGEDFLKRYATDAVAVRDAVSTAYADAMKAQGQQAPAATGEALAASNRSRLGLDFKDVVKRTPELQAAAAQVQAGQMSAEEYDRLVNETKPVEPYTSVPQPASMAEAVAALRKTNAEREGSPTKDAYYGRPAQTLKAGDPVGLRLDIPSYSKTGTWVVTVHEPRKNLVAGGAGTRIGYESVAAATDVQFSINEKGAIGIAAGKEKNTIATMEGKWKPTTPAQAKLKADQALKSKDWVQVGMDPERHSYFYDRATMRPVTAAAEVIQIGPLVLAKNPTYGEKSGFMFSNRARKPIKLSAYKPGTDNYNKQHDMVRLLNESVPAETIAKADQFVDKYFKERQAVTVSPEDRLKAEILLRPRMQAAEQVKPEYDQKILDIAARTGAAGQMLAPIKGLKRAAEKLAIEEDFNVDNIRDLLRSTIVVDSYADAPAIVEEIRKEFDVVRVKDRAGAAVLGQDVSAAPRENFGGYADILVNIRMPNGTVGEIQINTPAMLAAKDEQGHKLYEAAREQPEGSPLRTEIYDAMRVLYDAVFEAANRRQPSAQARNLASEMGAPRAGSESTAVSSSPESASLNTDPSGNLTNSSPENEATNSQPDGKEAGTFIEGSPDRSSLSQSLYTNDVNAPATKDEVTVDGIRFSNKGRDLVDVPTMELRDLVDKKVFGIKADLMDAGRSYTGIDGSQLMFPVEMLGGPNYPRLSSSQKQRTVWAVRGGAVLSKIMDKVKTADYVLVLAMNNNSHLTNSTASEAYIKTVQAYLRDGRISQDNLEALDKIVRSPKNKKSLPDFPGFEAPNIIEYIDKLSFDQRGALAKMLEKKEAQAHGLPNVDKFRRATLDPDYAGYRQGDAMLVLEVDKEDSMIKLGENGTKLHPAYPLALRGRVIGKLAKGVNYETIFRDYFRYAVPNFKNKEQGAWYSFDRKLPVQKITPEIASSISPGEYKAIYSPRQAEAALAMANSDWLVSGKTKDKGGISPQEFVDALAANDGAAALTQYPLKEVKAGIKAKSLRIYQLGSKSVEKKGLQVFFGLKRGRPWYADMIEGVGDNEVEVVSVTNNEPGAPGVGIPAIITKAILEGATVLDAFAVKSKRFPNGFLPEMYGQFGFEKIGSIPFDPSYYDANQLADLKAFWSAGGWKESDGYPDVVVMRWKGKDEDRAAAVERYVRTGETSVSEGDAQFTGSPTEDAHGQRDQSGAQQGGPRGADRGQAGGNQGVGNAAPVVQRAYGSIQELAGLSDGDIRNLGLRTEEVARLRDFLKRPGAAPASPTSGVQFSNRVSPADKIKWREITTVKQETSLDRLPPHIIPFADFMGTMATKASNGGLTVRDVIKAYTIARSSMNRGATSTANVVAQGLKLPPGFSDAKIRPEGAFGYWLLSPVGQRYLNAAEVGLVDQPAVDDAVKVMTPFGTQNNLGEDLKRAASGDLHTRLPGLAAAIKKASQGKDAVQDWQDALDNLYGVREAKKGFLGSLLGFGQLPTFDARQINVNVERESKEDTLRALGSTRAREVVATLARRMDALSLTMDPKYAPFYRHLAHHAVWDAVGGTETTHEDVVESMLMASNRAAFDAEGIPLKRYTPQVRQLPKVSPASALNLEIQRGLTNLRSVIDELKKKNAVPSKVVIGRMPHVMNMLGVRTQDFDIAASIVWKVFNGKHKDEFPDVSPREFVQAMYKPAMIFKDKGGNPREFEMVLPITNENGAVLMPIKVSVDNNDPLGAVLSLYNKRISNDPKSKNEMTIMRRIQQGNLLYVDPMLAKQAMTGRPRGGEKDGVRLNENFLSWQGVWPTVEKLIQDRKVKTDVDLMKWIGDNYDPATSEKGWEDAPAFSNRAAKPETEAELVALFKDLQDARGLGRIRAQERVDAHPMAEKINQMNNEFLDILGRLEESGAVKINCK